MIRVGSYEDGLAKRRKLKLENGAGYWKSEQIDSTECASLAPQGFLIEQDPDSTILTHFHFENEFQAVVGGSGTFGRHAVGPISIHYAAGHTGYGPINAGSDGLWYFTLRPRTEAGAHFLPGARAQMKASPKRAALAAPMTPSTADALRLRTGTAVETLIAPAGDAMGAWALRIGPNGVGRAPEVPGGEGSFYLVVAGTWLFADKRLGPLSIAFVSSDERQPEIQAGDNGVEVIAMQLPAPRAAP